MDISKPITIHINGYKKIMFFRWQGIDGGNPFSNVSPTSTIHLERGRSSININENKPPIAKIFHMLAVDVNLRNVTASFEGGLPEEKNTGLSLLGYTHLRL